MFLPHHLIESVGAEHSVKREVNQVGIIKEKVYYSGGKLVRGSAYSADCDENAARRNGWV